MALKRGLKSKWVKALKSGKYKQVREHLRHAGRFCCLGVLCEVAGMERKGKSYSITDENELGYDGCEVVGLSNEQQNTLIRMNDSAKMSFKEIASYIERNIKSAR